MVDTVAKYSMEQFKVDPCVSRMTGEGKMKNFSAVVYIYVHDLAVAGTTSEARRNQRLITALERNISLPAVR